MIPRIRLSCQAGTLSVAQDVAGAFGHIRCVNDDGDILHDLDNYLTIY